MAQIDALVIKIVENDARCNHLQLQCAVAKEGLEPIKRKLRGLESVRVRWVMRTSNFNTARAATLAGTGIV